MFLLTKRNIFGGREQVNLWKESGKNLNIHIDPDKGPIVVQDYFSWRIGWASEAMKKGDKIYLKLSDAQYLYKLLKLEFGYMD